MHPRLATLGLVAMALVLVGAAGCVPLVADAAALPLFAGKSIGEDAFRRASKEFSCPTDKINLVHRDDVLSGLFDVEACGQRARYNCRQKDECVREPDPARWDPDPVLCSTPGALKAKSINCVKPYSPYS